MKEDYADKVIARVVAELKRIRIERGLSHETLANLSGVTRPAISFMESGKRKPSLRQCIKVSEGLNVSLGVLIKKIEQSL